MLYSILIAIGSVCVCGMAAGRLVVGLGCQNAVVPACAWAVSCWQEGH